MDAELDLAVIQLSSRDDVAQNLQACAKLVAAAVARGARVVVLPENFAYFGPESGRRAHAERLGDTSAPIQAAVAKIARESACFVVAGGMPIASSEVERPYNALAAFEPSGALLGSYSKIHLFDVDLADGTSLRESASTLPGDEPRRLSLGGYPSWGKDPAVVYFHSRIDETLQSIQIDEPGAQPVTVCPCPSLYPAVSPDGKLLAYAIKSEVFVADLATGRRLQSWIAPKEQPGMLVQWSPDGRELSIGGFNHSELGLWIFDLKSAVAHQVLPGPVTLGVWSHDRARLAFDIRGVYVETWVAPLSDTSSTVRSLGSMRTTAGVPPPPDARLDGGNEAWLEHARRIRQLEDVLRLEPTSEPAQERLEQYRQILLPDLATFRSIDDAVDERRWRDLLPHGSSWRFFRGVMAPSPGIRWAEAGFDDSSWEQGPGGFGYGHADAATVLSDMKGIYTSLYIRRGFEIPGDGSVGKLRLSVLADDGFVAYLNGVEVGRVRAGRPGTRLPARAMASAKAPEPPVENRIELSGPDLAPGTHILALQGLNADKDSSDFLLSASLQCAPAAGVMPPSDLVALAHRFDDFRAAAQDTPEGPLRLAHLEGRLHELAGEHREAAQLFAEAAKGRALEPLSGLATSLCATGQAAEAAGRLGAALALGIESDAAAKQAMELWLKVALVELKWSAADVLRKLPEPAVEPRIAGSSLAAAYRADVRWLLEELATRGAVRINCGGEAFTSASGAIWGADRFFTSGLVHPGAWVDSSEHFTGDIAGTEDDPLYRVDRKFQMEPGRTPGYVLPLPPGRYQVRLHFARLCTEESNQRFDLHLEGRPALAAFQLGREALGVAVVQSFETDVEDGFLEVELVPRVSSPEISALEVIAR